MNSKQVGEVCPKCQKFIVSDSGCPNCDFGGATNSDKTNTGIYVPQGNEKKSEAKKVIKEEGDGVDYDVVVEKTEIRLKEKERAVNLEKGEKPHPAFKFANAVYGVRELILDSSRGIHSKQKYNGKSKQEVFDERIQKLGRFYREFDMRLVYDYILSEVTKTDSLRSKVGRYLRNSNQLRKRKLNESGVYSNTIYEIKDTRVKGRRIVFEGKSKLRNNKYRSEERRKKLIRLFRSKKPKGFNFKSLRGLF